MNKPQSREYLEEHSIVTSELYHQGCPQYQYMKYKYHQNHSMPTHKHKYYLK
jgi:hypothetical protein